MFASAANRVRSLVEWRLDKILDFVVRRPAALQPIEVEKAVCRAIDDGVRVFTRTIYAPNRITIKMNPADIEEYGKFMTTYLKEMTRTAEEHIETNFFQGKGSAEIRLEVIEDGDVPAGSVICEAEFVDKGTEQDNLKSPTGGKD